MRTVRSPTVRPWARAQWRITEVGVATVMGHVSTLTAEPTSAASDCLVPGSVEALNSRGAGCSDEVVTAVLGLVLDRRDESEFAV